MNTEGCNKEATKASFDPGWNDPPPLTFSAHQPTKPRNFLNKRVAFPCTGVGSPAATNSASTVPAGIIPPPIATPPRILKKDLTNDQEVVIDSARALEEVSSKLFKVLEESAELHSKANEIKKRISTMEEMWTSGKLNIRIQAQMQDLANALETDPKRSDEIHQLLMVQHVSAVSSWMPGVRQLIHSRIARADLLPIDEEIS